MYPWVSGPVNQSSELLSLQLHLANEKHRCATLTVTPLETLVEGTREHWGGQMNTNH